MRMIVHLSFGFFLLAITFFCVFLSAQSILKKSVTMLHTPSAVYEYSDAGGGNLHQNKVNAIFQAAKKDLLQVIQIQVAYNMNYIHYIKGSQQPNIISRQKHNLVIHLVIPQKDILVGDMYSG